MLESKFAEYNREHVQSILEDFSAGVNAKLDQFLKDKQAEAEYVLTLYTAASTN